VGTRAGYRATITAALAATVVDQSGLVGSAPPALSTTKLPGVGSLVGDHYRLVRLLGQGMFGKVYVAARSDVPAHQVALKIVPRELYTGRNVERELVMLAAASHPNIVQLKDHGGTDAYVWLTMPVYEGQTLADRLTRGPLSLEEAYDIFLPVARALHALHEAGLRHQDIKPENIFLATFAGRLHPILLDLGVAAEREAEFVAGTILYASPEQLSALSKSPDLLPLSDRMDTYCLAATLLVAVVGPENFPGEHAESRLEIVRAQEIRARRPLADGALGDVTGAARERLSEAFCRWMNPDPRCRPSTGEMADELEVLLEPQREIARRAERRRARFKMAGRAVVAGAIVFTSVGALFVFSKRETLRLASDLARARAEGAASFDKLDTCVASHQLSQRESQQCKDARSKDQIQFRATLEQLTRAGAAGPGERGNQVEAIQATYAARLRACEDETTSMTERQAEQDRLNTEWSRKQTQCTSERDEQQPDAAVGEKRPDAMRASGSVWLRLHGRWSAPDRVAYPRASGRSAAG